MEQLLVSLFAKFGVFAVSGIVLFLIGKKMFSKYNSLIDNLQLEKKELEKKHELSEKEHIDYIKSTAAEQIRTLDSNREAFRQMTAAFNQNTEVMKELIEYIIDDRRRKIA